MRRVKCDRCGRHNISEEGVVDVDNTPFIMIGFWMGTLTPSSGQDICIACVADFEEFMKGTLSNE